VLTLAQSCLDRLFAQARALQDLFAAPACLEFAGEPIFLPAMQDNFSRLRREIAWDAPGRDIAIDSCVLAILVDLLRLRGLCPVPPHRSPGPAASLVARYRARIEERFRLDHRIADYAASLGTSVARLRAACRSVVGQSPSELMRQRQLLEARRLLLYSNISVNEAAYSLGFEDPAYFSRVFSRGVGCSPRAFRRKEGVLF
jgi:AraC family transcriptional activator of pobA